MEPTTKNNIVAAFILDILNLSVIVAKDTSKILIPDVRAAAKSRTKNANAKIFT